jgi:hypothetical protein
MRGGPTFEFLFGIDKQLRRQRRRDQINGLPHRVAGRNRQPCNP